MGKLGPQNEAINKLAASLAGKRLGVGKQIASPALGHTVRFGVKNVPSPNDPDTVPFGGDPRLESTYRHQAPPNPARAIVNELRQGRAFDILAFYRHDDSSSLTVIATARSTRHCAALGHALRSKLMAGRALYLPALPKPPFGTGRKSRHNRTGPRRECDHVQYHLGFADVHVMTLQERERLDIESLYLLGPQFDPASREMWNVENMEPKESITQKFLDRLKARTTLQMGKKGVNARAKAARKGVSLLEAAGTKVKE
eukprot:Clim_evm121s210 gene=Clim_evmTU121s210